jgi:hypothetical protein
MTTDSARPSSVVRFFSLALERDLPVRRLATTTVEDLPSEFRTKLQ